MCTVFLFTEKDVKCTEQNVEKSGEWIVYLALLRFRKVGLKWCLTIRISQIVRLIQILHDAISDHQTQPPSIKWMFWDRSIMKTYFIIHYDRHLGLDTSLNNWQ